MKYEFTIYGSGISAKLASSLLAKNGFKVCLISDKDRNQDNLNTNLVTFLSEGSINYLLSMFTNIRFINDYPEIQKINCQLNSLISNRSQSISFSNTNNESLGKIIKNIEIEAYLDQEIHQSSNIYIINLTELNSVQNKIDGVELKLQNNQIINSDLFILSSTKKNIAEQTKINFIKKNLEQTALSIKIQGTIKNENNAFQKFTSDGPLALLPYAKQEASVVWSLKNNSNILIKDNEELTDIISKHLSEYIDLKKIVSIEKHKLQFNYAKTLCYKNTVLLGNIAHNIHPIAGQGLNLTIKDIALFLKQIIKFKSLGYKLNDQMILEGFEMKRKLDNAAYSFGTFSLNGILSSNSKLLNYTTRKGLGLIEKSNKIKEFLVRSATGKEYFKSF